ncbi:MAG TPA: Gfo/Idh/MocA family oxidoreductase [Gemmatimonadaceae bacterium]|nr:Gfo/Idh/MocA family oxidoreductase [Gemmatimonadaceae bacterium]
MSKKEEITRRDFVADASKLALGAVVAPRFPMIVPRHVLGGKGYTAPSAMLNIAIVGCGGQGSGNARSVASENLVAFCDVDPAFMEKNVMSSGGGRAGAAPSPETLAFRDKYQKATKYVDFREMLAKQRDLDAVIIATPDHMHATVAAAAMRAGKHVYVQKPLTFSVYESRLLKRLAKENKVVTQMGNQGHSGDGTRRVVEWIRAGVIGPVREVHIYTDRPARYWAQGLPRPTVGGDGSAAMLKDGNVRAVSNALAAALANVHPTMPEGLRWDLYLGPVAEDIPYHPVYHPFTWRGWTDFGCGALGDMGAHLIDQAYWSLGLTYPTSIEATSSLWGTTPVPPPPGSPEGTRPTQKNVSFPMASTVHYQFPAVGPRPAVKLNWYDGGLFPPRPDGLPDDVKFDSEGGGIFIGDKGILIHNTYGEKPRLFPATVAEAGAAVAQTLPRIVESHQMNWVRACKGETEASSPFEYGAMLNETMVLGVAALRAGQGRKVIYDAEKMEFTNAPDANQFLTREYREGWKI